MFAQPKDVESDLIGQFDLFDKVAQPGFGGRGLPRYPARAGIAKGVKPDFDVYSLLMRGSEPQGRVQRCHRLLPAFPRLQPFDPGGDGRPGLK